MSKTVLVVGGGLGGLAVALRLRRAGCRVRLFEQSESMGGKCGCLRRDGFHFDTGPSLLTLPEVIRETFTCSGVELEDYLTMESVEPGCRYHFPDGLCFDAPGNIEGMRAAVASAFPEEAKAFGKFLRYLDNLWEISGPVFLENPLHWRTFAKVPYGRLLRGLDAIRPGSMHRVLRGFFRDPRLIQLFSRFATYNGSDPYRTPSTFNVIAHVEFAFGAWRIRGGMYGLVEALVRRGLEMGVEMETGCPVEEVVFQSGKAAGLRCEAGREIFGDAVVINADAATARTGNLLAGHSKGPKPGLNRREASSGGFVLLLAVDQPASGLATHNIVFTDDYRREFKELFHQPRPLTDPTLYVSVPAVAEPSLAPPDQSGWFVLVNAPSLQGFRDWKEEVYSSGLIDRLQSSPLRLRPEKILWLEARSPRWFERTLGAWQGSLYGPSSNTLLSAFLREKNDPGIPGVYFAGGSAHPGGGIPLVLLSAKHAAEALLRGN